MVEKTLQQCPETPRCAVAQHNACSMQAVHRECGVYHQLLARTTQQHEKNPNLPQSSVQRGERNH